MKNYVFSILAVTTLLTAGQPILAQDSSSRMELEDVEPVKLSEMNPRLNPQLGLSNFEHSNGKGSNNSAAFGTTIELGQTEIRKLETGLMIFKMGSDAATATHLAIPMMAKLRIFATKAQSWYGKFGMIPTYELSSSDDRKTNDIDILMAAGFGGRLVLSKDLDFIVEGTFNRGLIDNVRGGKDEYNQGFLMLGGLSIRI